MVKYKPPIKTGAICASIQADRLISSGLSHVQELLHADESHISGAARIIFH